MRCKRALKGGLRSGARGRPSHSDPFYAGVFCRRRYCRIGTRYTHYAMATVAKATTTATTTTMLATSGAASEPATNATATATTTPPQALDLATLLTRQQIQHHLSLLTAHEQQLDARLQHLISPVTRQTRLITQLRALDSLSQVVGGIEMEAQVMRAKVADVADTAERVGGTVRKLDLEQVRTPVSSHSEPTCSRRSADAAIRTGARVPLTVPRQAIYRIRVRDTRAEAEHSCARPGHPTSRLGNCDAVHAARDDERLARSVEQRFCRSCRRESAFPPSCTPTRILTAYADVWRLKPTSDLPQSPPSTLAALRATLLDTFTTAFKSAAAQQDTQNINRFFKLFPMIGEDDTGLKVYAEWVGGIVRDRCGSAGMSAAGGKGEWPASDDALESDSRPRPSVLTFARMQPRRQLSSPLPLQPSSKRSLSS